MPHHCRSPAREHAQSTTSTELIARTTHLHLRDIHPSMSDGNKSERGLQSSALIIWSQHRLMRWLQYRDAFFGIKRI